MLKRVLAAGFPLINLFFCKGHTLTFKGDVAGARVAYRRAVQLNQNF
jgi:hypothetical protein